MVSAIDANDKDTMSVSSKYTKDTLDQSSTTTDTLWDLEASTRKWKSVRAGNLVPYQPFAIAEEEGPDPNAPPFDPDEPMSNARNWPKSCPLLHLDFNDFHLKEKQAFARFMYHFWHYLTFTLVWNLLGQIVTQLITPTPSPEQALYAFLLAFCGFWWFFFGYFRAIYFAMRHRNATLYTYFLLHTTLLFAISIYFIFNNVGSLVQMLSPLAPGSMVPVRQNPKMAAVFVSVAMFLWFIVLMTCFYIIRKGFFYKNLSIEQEFVLYREELMNPAAEAAGSFGAYWSKMFAPTADIALEPLRCALLVPTKKAELWVQGTLTFDVIAFDFVGDLPVFDHLIQEKYSYYDVIEVTKFQKTMIMLKLELGRKRVLHEMVFDLGSRALRTSTFAATRQLVARVGRNTDLVVFEHERLQRGGLVGPYQDPTEKFARTRREETVGRLGAHLVTYRDWQKLLAAAACRVYQPGDRVLQPGDTVSCLFHVAQGGVRVLDTQSSATEVDEEKALAEYKARAEDEVMDWVQETMVQNKVAELERAEWGVEGMKEDVDIEAGSSHSGSESDDTESDEEEEPKEVEDKAAGMVSASGVTLGLIRKGDVFGVVPFLLNYDPQASMPKTNFAFEVTQPDTVIFSLDADILKNNLLGSKKEVTAAWFKYLAVILGERVEFAEDAMFSQHLHDHSQAELRKEEELLEEKRRAEEAAGFVLDADHSPVTIQDIFGFSVTEELHKEFASEFFTYEKRNNIRTELRLKGTLYLTDHYVAFFGGPAKLMSSTKHKVVIPFEEIVFLKNEKQRAILVCDQMLEKKLIVLKTSEAREEVMRFLMKKWRREDMETGAQARALLRRRITMLTNNQLEFVESSIKGTAHSVLSEMSEKDKRGLFMGTIPIAMQRNQVVIQEDMGNSTLYLLQAGVVRIQRLREHVGGETGTGRAAEKVVFHEINAGEMFGFDSFLTGESSSSSYLVDSEKAIIRCCTKQQIMERLKEDKRLASKFYRVAAVSLALRLAEISPLDVLF